MAKLDAAAINARVEGVRKSDMSVPIYSTKQPDVRGALTALSDVLGTIAVSFELLGHAETGAAMFSRWSGELRALMPIERRPLTRADLAERLDMAELDIPGLVARGIIPAASIAIGNSVGWPDLPDWTDKIQAKLEGLRIAHVDAGVKVPTWLQRRATPISMPVSAAVDDNDI
ncbi:hypothetical protein [Rhizobium ruizarguesonis]|uniref:hypothetical protein n=1 Tax=Rhizobium ruizarguesonis TaxID=2081791 RepID=UPI001032622C|nr:hypothetical protein [Rhizobium ruizarguesonis]TAY73525.1 hypothetical protein ELH84_06365 [Rhizobium ruizarguesonis]